MGNIKERQWSQLEAGITRNFFKFLSSEVM